MVKVEMHSAIRAVKKTQHHWTKQLKRIELKDLELVSTFAKGGSSRVSLVHLRGHEETFFALKTLQKSKIRNLVPRQMLLTEKKILSEVQSDFVVKFYKTFKNKKFLYILTEYLPGGDLNKEDKFTEEAARFYAACVVEALDCLHKQNIAHNDIKPSNLVLDAEGYAKLIDFGFAFQLPPGERKQGFRFGTLRYVPPEVQHGTRDKGGDLWALGVLLYKLMTGKTPFDTDGNRKTIWKNIMKGIDSVQFPRSCFSEEAENLIKRLCSNDPYIRLGYGNIEKIRQHRWFDGFEWKKLRNRELTPPCVPKLDSVRDTSNFLRTVVDYDPNVEDDDSNWDVDF